MADLTTTTDLCRLLSDATRVRLLAVAGAEELTVAELTEVTGLAQSRVSTHLGALREAGLVRARRHGSSTYYSLEPGMPPEAAKLWALVRDAADDPLLDQDRGRMAEVVSARQSGWADQTAGSMSRHYSPGRTWESAARAIVGLLRLGAVIDIASGDGAIAELLVPRARQVTCLDRSPKVVASGQERLSHLGTLRFVEGDMHDLPFEDASFDQALLMSSLCYAERPARVVEEAARVLVPGGALIGTALRAHNHTAAVAPFDHVQMGFEPDHLASLLRAAGLEVETCEITSRESRPPHFEVVTFAASKPAKGGSASPSRRPRAR